MDQPHRQRLFVDMDLVAFKAGHGDLPIAGKLRAVMVTISEDDGNPAVAVNHNRPAT